MKKIGLIITTIMATMMFGAMVSAAPAQVTGVKQVDAYKSSASLEWNEVAGDYIYYDVEYSTSSNFATVSTVRTSAESYYLSGLAAGSTYYVRIRAYEYGTTDYSAYSDTFEIVTDPDAQSIDVKLTNITTSSVTFGWNAIQGATGYQIEDIDGNVYATTNTTSYTFKTIPDKYFYVYAVRKSPTFTGVSTVGGYISKYDIKFVPKKMTQPYVSLYFSESKSVSVDWAEVPEADSYQIQYSIYNKKKAINTYTTVITSKNLDKIKPNRFYKMRVRAGVNVDDKTVYGAWSDYTYFAQPIKPKIPSFKKNSISFTWKKVKGAKSYQIFASTKENPNSFKKVKTTKSNKFTLTKIKKKKVDTNKKKYYISVVAVMKNGKKKYVSYPAIWEIKKTIKFY